MNFWLSAFLLPKGCIRAIEALCSRFLWSGNLEKRGIAKMSWSTVCLPKKEGGLGLRSFLVWNRVLCLRFIWILLSQADSLWANWHRDLHLQNKCFWDIEPSQNDSWAWKNLLKLRPFALTFCRTKLGNGQSTSFWFDSWTPLGQLINLIGPLGPRSLRIRKYATVADAIHGTNWSLPHPRSQQEVDLHAYLTTISLPLDGEVDDELEWVAGNYPLRTFNSATTWEVLRPRHEEQDWVDVVWFKGSVPKQAFNMWITNGDRLPTFSRLASWGIPVSPNCILCSSHVETRDHLLLSCDYSLVIWKEVLSRCQSTHVRFTNWAELLSWIRASPSKRITLLRKLACQATVYHLWKQRNNFVRNQTSIPAAAVFHGIDREMRNIISSRKHMKNFNSLMCMWLS